MKGILLTPELLVQNMKPVIEACNLWQNKSLKVIVIANPTAGGFTQKKKSVANASVMQNAAESATVLLKNGKKTEIDEIILNKTEYAGHAAKIAMDLLKDASQSNKDYLIITAGGDGTHLEVQTALLKAAFADATTKKLVTNKITILRLPFGTGNDGSDGRELTDTLERLTKPAHFALQKAVKVWYEGKHPDGESKRKVDTYDSLDVLPPWYASF